MSCCGGGGGGSGNGAFPKRYESGCNCSRGHRHPEGSGRCCESETTTATTCQTRGRRETTPKGPTGGCGRHGCPRIVYPPPEPPEVEWEYTNYNRNKYRWPATVLGKVYPGYENDYVDEKQDYQSDNYEEFEEEENAQKGCAYCDEFTENEYQQPCERFAGGSDDFEENGQSYLDYYYEKEPIDQQIRNAERTSSCCSRPTESRSTTDSDTDDSRGRRKVHF